MPKIFPSLYLSNMADRAPKVRGYSIKVSPDKIRQNKWNNAVVECMSEPNTPPPLPLPHPSAGSSDYGAADPKSTPFSHLVLPWVGVETQGVKVAHKARWCRGAKSLIWGTKERGKRVSGGLLDEVDVPTMTTRAETACLMKTRRRIVYRLAQQKPCACLSPATEFALYLRQQESGSALQAY